MGNKILIICTVILLLVPSFAFAKDDVSIGIQSSTGSENVVTFKIKYLNKNVDSVEALFKYNVDKLEYVSGGTSSGNTGEVFLKGADGKTDFDLKFKGKGTKKTSITLVTEKALNINGKAINIKDKTKTVALIQGGVAEENKSVTEEATKKEDIITEDVIEEPLESNMRNTIIVFGSFFALCILGVFIVSLIYFQKKKK
ncbi:MAG: hypothetical protein RSA49_03295 [Anaerovoracaceae bacterium]